MVLGFIAAYLGIMLMDLPVIVKSNKLKKTIIIYLVILSISFTITLLQALDKTPMSPSDAIAKVIDTFIK